MTTFPNVEFHNCAAPEPWDLGPGWLLPRYPKAVRLGMERGRVLSGDSTGVEIRFVTEATNIRVYLTSPDQDTEVQVFLGGFFHSSHKLAAGVHTAVLLTAVELFPRMDRAILETGPFSPDVWRIVLNRGVNVLHGIETYGHALRPPAVNEKPRLKWLAYGSSITQSSWKGYPAQAAWRLGVDVLNKGLSGACHIEDTTARFLAREVEWDFATVELGVNVRDKFSPEEFEARSRYLLEELTSTKPYRPVAVITVFPNNVQHQLAQPVGGWVKEQAFNDALRRLAKEFAAQNVHLIEGSRIVRDFTYHTIDLLHPAEFGHVRMGEHLAEELRPIIEGL
jgi:lysophospholipase L1-like esterase